MHIIHLKKSTMGNGGCKLKQTNKANIAKSYSTHYGSGITQNVFDDDLGGNRPTSVLRNIKIKKTRVPKKYITFE